MTARRRRSRISSPASRTPAARPRRSSRSGTTRPARRSSPFPALWDAGDKTFTLTLEQIDAADARAGRARTPMHIPLRFGLVLADGSEAEPTSISGGARDGRRAASDRAQPDGAVRRPSPRGRCCRSTAASPRRSTSISSRRRRISPTSPATTATPSPAGRRLTPTRCGCSSAPSGRCAPATRRTATTR